MKNFNFYSLMLKLIIFTLITCISAQFTYGQLSGSYNVGSKQPAPFNSIDAVFAVLSSKGVSGPVSFYLEDASYPTQSPTLYEIPGSSTTNTVTFRPANGANPVLTCAKANSTLILNFSAVNNVIIDGSYNDADTTKHLTFMYTGKSSDLISYSDGGIDKQISNFTLKNCILLGNGGVGLMTNRNTSNKCMTKYSNFNIIHNQFSYFSYSFELLADNASIIGNEFYNNYWSPFLYIGSLCEIKNNIISNNLNGINIASSNNCVIEMNKIVGGIKSKLAIQISNSTSIIINNNLIVGKFNCGIHTLNSNLSILYNTIRILPTSNSYTGQSLGNNCISIEDVATQPVKIRNTICELDETNCIGCTQGSVIFGSSVVSTTSQLIDETNNVYFSTSSSNFYDENNNSLFKTFLDWKAAGNSPQSLSKEQKSSFISATDLHLAQANQIGIPLIGLTTDIESYPRDLFHPNAGAFEFVPIAVTPTISLIGQCQGSAIQFTTTGIPTDSWSALWDFGDDQTSTALAPTHNYVATGTYTVTLNITTSNGQQQQISKAISVYAQPTKPSIIINNGK